MAEETMPPGTLTRKSILTFLGLAMSCAALTTLFLSMRAVMEIGGACGSGGAVVYRRACPEGTGGLMMFSIFGGLIFLGVYAFSTYALNLVAFAWPALFISLGYNFFDYGINPPNDDGAVVGWLICGVLFFLMGGVPLAFAIWALANRKDSKLARAVTTKSLDASRLRQPLRRGTVKPRRSGGVATTTATATTDAPPGTHSWSVIDALERLSAMHERGELDDGEYEAAKDQVLADEEQS